MLKRLTLLALVVALLFGVLVVVGCGSGTTGASTTTTAVTSSSDTTTSSEGATSTTAPGEVKTLKIGYAGWLGFFVGLDTQRCLEVRVKMINDAGGLKVGSDTYKIELVSYDTNNDQATAQAVANKLVFQDKVQFIVWTDFFWNAVLPITEANKVITTGADLTQTVLKPQYHYCFNTGIGTASTDIYIGWFAKNYPDKKTVIMALTDDAIGHPAVDTMIPVFAAFGLTRTNEYYPPSATDLSALGTKVKNANPDVMMAAGGTFQTYAAARQAGYTGLFYNPAPSSVATMLAGVGDPTLIEGLVGGGSPLEFDPPLTDTAAAFKEAWIVKYGKWEAPEVSGVAHFDAIVAAIQKAGSVDPDKVAEALASGLEFESAYGVERMIARPDLGNTRTIDNITTAYIKKVVGGKPQLLATIGPDEGLSYFQQVIDATSKQN
jgi:branched-chain amino acid transport system substrate-binding protein